MCLSCTNSPGHYWSRSCDFRNPKGGYHHTKLVRNRYEKLCTQSSKYFLQKNLATERNGGYKTPAIISARHIKPGQKLWVIGQIPNCRLMVKYLMKSYSQSLPKCMHEMKAYLSFFQNACVPNFLLSRKCCPVSFGSGYYSMIEWPRKGERESRKTQIGSNSPS